MPNLAGLALVLSLLAAGAFIVGALILTTPTPAPEDDDEERTP